MEEQSATRSVLVAVVEGRRQGIKMGRTCYLYGGTERYKKSSGCSGRRKKTEGQGETKMGRWCDGRCQEVGGEKLEECCKE